MLERILHHCDSCFQFPSPIATWNTTPAFGYKPDIQLRSHKGRKRHFWAKCHIRDGVLPQICLPVDLAHCGRWSPGTSGICRRVFSSWFVCPPPRLYAVPWGLQSLSSSGCPELTQKEECRDIGRDIIHYRTSSLILPFILGKGQRQRRESWFPVLICSSWWPAQH